MFWLKVENGEIERMKQSYPDNPVCVCSGYCYVFRDALEWDSFKARHPESILVNEYDPLIK